VHLETFFDSDGITSNPMYQRRCGFSILLYLACFRFGSARYSEARLQY
jgi:hypothetical protein